MNNYVNIKRGPGWYELESGSSAQNSFPELEELVSHYSSEPIVISEERSQLLRGEVFSCRSQTIQGEGLKVCMWMD